MNTSFFLKKKMFRIAFSKELGLTLFLGIWLFKTGSSGYGTVAINVLYGKITINKRMF